MSTYVREKVLRVPLEFINLSRVNTKEIEDLCDIEEAYVGLFEYATPNFFQTAPTERYFIDYVLDYEDDVDGEYGRIRELYATEKEKYLPIFKRLDKNIDMNKVHLVEFCWYNGTEAPDYYEISEDEFYKEV